MCKPEDSRGSPSLDRVGKKLEKRTADELSGAERVALEQVVWRKLDRWILPLCTIFHLLSFLVCFTVTLAVHTMEDL